MIGNNLLDKLKILLYGMLDSIPRAIRKRSRIIESVIARSAEILKGVTIETKGLKYALVDEDSLYFFTPVFEPWMENYLKPKRGDIFLDVGAHIGRYAIQVAKSVGREGLVVAVEPFPGNYVILKHNIDLNSLDNVITSRVAAWKEERNTMKLYIGPRRGYNTLKHDTGLGYVNVRGKRLDNILKELSIRHLDWIKIDVEGAEHEVLQGLMNTLQTNRHVRVIAEVAEANRPNVFSFMRQMGYEVFNMVNAKDNYYFKKEARSPVGKTHD